MQRISYPRSGIVRALAAGAAILIILTGRMLADVVLHPATVTGTVGLTNWTFDNGSVSVSGNANGFFGSAPTSGGSYSVTVEGGQTYTSLSESLWSYSPYYTTFGLSRTTSLTVPAGGTASGQDLLAPGGTIHLNFSATAAPGATAVINSIGASAYASNAAGTEYYYGSVYPYGVTTAQVPMAATQAAINVYGYASFSLTDQNGRTCGVYQSIPYPYPTIAGLSEGETATIDLAFDLSSELCASGVGTINGTVQFNSLPAGFNPTNGYVCASGAGSQCAQISTNPLSYSFDNLPIGSYYIYGAEYFGNSSGLSISPNGGGNYAYLQAGDVVTRNFLYDAALVQGNFTIGGSLASRLLSATGYSYAQFGFRPDPFVSNPPNAGNYAYTSLQGPLSSATQPFTVGLTAGPWQQPDFYAASYGNNDSFSLSVYDQAASRIDVAPGATVAFDRTVDTTEAEIVFDVIEQPGQPAIGISYPYIYISQWDQASQRYVYISSQSYAVNQPTPVVKIDGPAGRYQFQAYAQILGSWVSFATSTIDLGLSVNTPVGTNQQVTLLDASGNPTGVQLTFSNVTADGQTTASTTTVGPVPPGGFTLMPAFNGTTYLSINTTATFTGTVEVALTYDPIALGLTPATERFLQLWHFHCDASGNNCAWQYINDPAKSPNPSTISHTIYGVTDSFSDFALLLPTSSQPPAVNCVGTEAHPMIVSASAASCLASVDNVNGVAGTCSGGGGGLASCTFDGASSLSLGLGARSIVVKGTANDGSSAQCTSYVTVADTTAPAVSVAASPTVLWPPNHKLVPIQLTTTASDACSAQPVVSCSVSSNEPANTTGDGNTNGDIVWNNGQLFLRAERQGSGTGRIYTIACAATDASGNAVTGTTTVKVPHDQSR